MKYKILKTYYYETHGFSIENGRWMNFMYYSDEYSEPSYTTDFIYIGNRLLALSTEDDMEESIIDFYQIK